MFSGGAEAEGHLRPSGGRALLIDGRAAADVCFSESARKRRCFWARGKARTCNGAGRRESGEPSLCRKGRAARASGFHSVQHDLPRETSEADLLPLFGVQRGPAIHGILVQLPLPKASTRPGARGDRAGKGRRRLHPVNVGLLAIGDARALVPCTPAGAWCSSMKLRARSGVDLRGRCADRRPLQHRRQADGAAAARRRCDGDDRAFAQAAICRRLSRARRYPRRCRRPAGNGPGRLDQARRNRHRRRHQSCAGRGPDAGEPQDATRRRRRLCGSRGARGRDHAGARRRRADDDRHADGEHAASGETTERRTLKSRLRTRYARTPRAGVTHRRLSASGGAAQALRRHARPCRSDARHRSGRVLRPARAVRAAARPR